MGVTDTYRKGIYELVLKLFEQAKIQFEEKNEKFLKATKLEAEDLAVAETKGKSKYSWPEYIQQDTELAEEIDKLKKQQEQLRERALMQCFPDEVEKSSYRSLYSWWSYTDAWFEKKKKKQWKKVLQGSDLGRQYLDFETALTEVGGMIALAQSSKVIIELYVGTAARLGVKIPDRYLQAIGVKTKPLELPAEDE